uniref:Uncharacterized protein n=1 Tax=Parascaris equorum TaxID=6256 RepID=A0A914RX22_PAREQ
MSSSFSKRLRNKLTPLCYPYMMFSRRFATYKCTNVYTRDTGTQRMNIILRAWNDQSIFLASTQYQHVQTELVTTAYEVAAATSTASSTISRTQNLSSFRVK